MPEIQNRSPRQDEQLLVARDANGIPETTESTDPVATEKLHIYKVSLIRLLPRVWRRRRASLRREFETNGTVPCVNGTVAADWLTPSGYGVGQARRRPPRWRVETLYVLVQVQRAPKVRPSRTPAAGDYDQVDSNKDNNTSSASFTVGGSISGTIYNDKGCLADERYRYR